jgi:Right handed beta helix region
MKRAHWFLTLLATSWVGRGQALSMNHVQLNPAGPIKTLAAARDAARAMAKPVTVTVAAGEYPLTEPLTLTAEDSHVTWTAAPGASPVISGGRRLTGWKKVAASPGLPDLWQTVVPEAAQGHWRFIQLWINGRRATLARTPNLGFFAITDSCGQGVFPQVKEPAFQAFCVAPQVYEIISGISEAERPQALITVTHAWAVGQCRIAALHDQTQAVMIKGRAAYPFVEFEPDQRYWLENFRGALDAPGEWFLDAATGTVLYHPLPGEDMTKADVIAPVSDRFLDLTGVRETSFRGLQFSHEQYLYPAEGLHDGQAALQVDAAIQLTDCEHVTFDHCEVSHTGRHAFHFKNGTKQSGITHCRLTDLGGGGVCLGERKRPSEERLCEDLSIDDCIIQHGGRLHPSACGINLTHTRRCRVSHCDIGDFYYTGISAGWVWGYGENWSRENQFINNHIHHLGWAYLSDMGGFYGLGNAPGTVIKGNHIHHIASHRYGGWGLYTDEGSGDVLMENNLVHDTSNAGFHQHYGYANRIRNNIFAFGHEAQIQRSRSEPHLSFSFEKNIVVWSPGSPLLDGGQWNWAFHDPKNRQNGYPKDSLIFRRNLYWQTDGQQPSHLTRKDYTWAEWTQMGRDEGSQWADPGFQNLDQRDFRLRGDSPAVKLGFKPWDLTLAGVKKADPAWVTLAAAGHHYPTWDKQARPWPSPTYEVPLQTFEHTALGHLGLRNATVHKDGPGDEFSKAIGVTEGLSSPLPSSGEKGNRCLKIMDGPQWKQAWQPVIDIGSKWAAGTVKVSFDAMGEPGAAFFFEARESVTGEYAAGPILTWKDSELTAGVKPSISLAKIPAGEWFRLRLTATTGSGHYAVTLTRQDGTVQEFPSIDNQKTWTAASYLLFSSLSVKPVAYYLDNVSLMME